MKQGFKSEHWNDENGSPAGGCSYGTGWVISWQNGPLGRGNERKEPNGAFVEDVFGGGAKVVRPAYKSTRTTTSGRYAYGVIRSARGTWRFSCLDG